MRSLTEPPVAAEPQARAAACVKLGVSATRPLACCPPARRLLPVASPRWPRSSRGLAVPGTGGRPSLALAPACSGRLSAHNVAATLVRDQLVVPSARSSRSLSQVSASLLVQLLASFPTLLHARRLRRRPTHAHTATSSRRLVDVDVLLSDPSSPPLSSRPCGSPSPSSPWPPSPLSRASRRARRRSSPSSVRCARRTRSPARSSARRASSLPLCTALGELQLTSASLCSTYGDAVAHHFSNGKKEVSGVMAGSGGCASPLPLARSLPHLSVIELTPRPRRRVHQHRRGARLVRRLRLDRRGRRLHQDPRRGGRRLRAGRVRRLQLCGRVAASALGQQVRARARREPRPVGRRRRRRVERHAASRSRPPAPERPACSSRHAHVALDVPSPLHPPSHSIPAPPLDVPLLRRVRSLAGPPSCSNCAFDLVLVLALDGEFSVALALYSLHRLVPLHRADHSRSWQDRALAPPTEMNERRPRLLCRSQPVDLRST